MVKTNSVEVPIPTTCEFPGDNTHSECPSDPIDELWRRMHVIEERLQEVASETGLDLIDPAAPK